MIQQGLTTSFKLELLQGVQSFGTGDMKLALYKILYPEFDIRYEYYSGQSNAMLYPSCLAILYVKGVPHFVVNTLFHVADSHKGGTP